MQKSWRRKIALFLAAVLLVLNACGKKAAPAETIAQTQDETEKGTQDQTQGKTEDETQNGTEDETEIGTIDETETQEAEPDDRPNHPIAETPMFTEIRHDVLCADQRTYTTDETMEGFRKTLAAIEAHEDKVRVTDSWDDNLWIMSLLRTSPYAFVLEEYDLTRDHKSIYFEYKYSKEEIREMYDFIDQEYLKILNEIIWPGMSQAEQVLAVYQYFGDRISYDYDWLEALDMSDEKFMFPDIVVYEALKTGYGVCHTYSYLCQFALQQLGIESVRASADMQDSDSGHMWLIVWIDGECYHIDPTWDSKWNGTGLNYFGMTDDECEDRGVVRNWRVNIDVALDVDCDSERFDSLHDVSRFELLGNNRLKVWRGENENYEIISLE